MNAPTKPRRTITDKGELRRQQVLDAATQCFRREGFHGSSIARISQAAGMSPGHIYHYFANKEAIVKAIAEREELELDEILRDMEKDQAGGKVADRIVRDIPMIIERNSAPERVGLWLELAAEAARNPTVREILQRSDESIAMRFNVVAKRIGLPEGMDARDFEQRMEIIAMMLYGLALRSLVKTETDPAETARHMETVIRALLEDRA